MPESKKRIAFFGIKAFPAYAGADRVVENIINNSNDNLEYYIYLIDIKNKVIPFENKHFIYLPALPGKHLKAFSFFIFCTLHILFTNYDLIHAHNSDVGLFTYLLQFKFRRRIVGTFHGKPYLSSKWGRFAKFYLSISEWFFIKSCTILTSQSKSQVFQNKVVEFIPNGVETIKLASFLTYRNTSIKYESLNIQRNNYVLFACARLIRLKGLHYLLAAYRAFHFDEQLVIIGDFTHEKDYSIDIQEQISAFPAGKVVVIKRLLPKYDLFDMIINSRLVVFPSEQEASSLFLSEVLACEKIVVCSDIQENINIVGKNYKYKFETKNVCSLGTSMRNALEDSHRLVGAKQMKKHTGFRYQQDWGYVTKEYSRLYNSLMT